MSCKTGFCPLEQEFVYSNKTYRRVLEAIRKSRDPSDMLFIKTTFAEPNTYPGQRALSFRVISNLGSISLSGKYHL
ncbi:MAG: hypothetical protein HXY44_08120 [Syntrophaceae bacterium]|nr:hypothetical protein [Syntrophaceae bacterium]